MPRERIERTNVRIKIKFNVSGDSALNTCKWRMTMTTQEKSNTNTKSHSEEYKAKTVVHTAILHRCAYVVCAQVTKKMQVKGSQFGKRRRKKIWQNTNLLEKIHSKLILCEANFCFCFTLQSVLLPKSSLCRCTNCMCMPVRQRYQFDMATWRSSFSHVSLARLNSTLKHFQSASYS